VPLLFAALHGDISAQTTVKQGAAPPQVKHDAIYVSVQGPPPTVNVEAQSQWPAVALGIAGVLLLGLQLWIMGRQTDAMNRQTAILDKQTALAEQQAVWRRDEAVGTFYRVAHELANELRKANVMAGTPIPANFHTETRQWLREAARLFAPLGNDVVFTATASAMYLDLYFEAVASYNKYPRGRDGAQWTTVQQAREQVGRNLDATSLLIPAELRWKYGDGTAYSFRKLCMMPEGLARQLGGPTDPRGEET
jgi:hypothetical protein